MSQVTTRALATYNAGKIAQLQFPNLCRLTLWGSAGDDCVTIGDCLPLLASLTGMEHLTLRSCSLSGAGVQHLHRLRSLELRCCASLDDAVSGALLPGIATLSRLTALRLHETAFSLADEPSHWTCLKHLTALGIVALTHCRLEEETLRHLGALEMLQVRGNEALCAINVQCEAPLGVAWWRGGRVIRVV